jgi:hypothetical protein
VVFRHHKIGDHAATFADIELMRPMIVIGGLCILPQTSRCQSLRERNPNKVP